MASVSTATKTLTLNNNVNTDFYTITRGENSPIMRLVDKRNTIQKISDVVMAVLRMFTYLVENAVHFVNLFKERKTLFIAPIKIDNIWHYETKDYPWNTATESEGLVLLVHGLRGKPFSYGGYIKDLKALSPNSHIIAPQVAEQGNCSCEIAAEPFLELVEAYLKKFPGKPVTLIGTSNGSRIISYIENKLPVELMEKRKLNVVSIVGVHYGTKFVDTLDRFRLLFLAGLNSKLGDEFRWGSSYAEKLLTEWNKKQDVWAQHNVNARHFFCTTFNDEKVFDNTSSLPDLKGDTDYRVYRGENHQSIVDRARGDVIAWLKA